MFDDGTVPVAGRRVLELGAGAGLPSVVAALQGAARVVATDYPDADLLDNIRVNVESNMDDCSCVEVVGYLWGADTAPLRGPFDVVVLADLVFNHTQHTQLLDSVRQCLAPDGVAIVGFTHHRPWLAERDMGFFKLAAYSFSVQHERDVAMPPMFIDDPGSVDVRSTVHVYTLKSG